MLVGGRLQENHLLLRLTSQPGLSTRDTILSKTPRKGNQFRPAGLSADCQTRESTLLAGCMAQVSTDVSAEMLEKMTKKEDPSLHTLSAVASSFRDDDPQKEEDEVRKAMLRERNREHARLSRQRKRQRLEQLQDENETLSRDCKAARDECARLRDLLERCDHENARLRSWIDSIIAPRSPVATHAAPPPPPAYAPSYRY